MNTAELGKAAKQIAEEKGRAWEYDLLAHIVLGEIVSIRAIGNPLSLFPQSTLTHPHFDFDSVEKVSEYSAWFKDALREMTAIVDRFGNLFAPSPKTELVFGATGEPGNADAIIETGKLIGTLFLEALLIQNKHSSMKYSIGRTLPSSLRPALRNFIEETNRYLTTEIARFVEFIESTMSSVIQQIAEMKLHPIEEKPPLRMEFGFTSKPADFKTDELIKIMDSIGDARAAMAANASKVPVSTQTGIATTHQIAAAKPSPFDPYASQRHKRGRKSHLGAYINQQSHNNPVAKVFWLIVWVVMMGIALVGMFSKR